MEKIYLAYLIGCIASLILYKQSRLGSLIGFSVAAVASAAGLWHFLTHLNVFEKLEIPFPIVNATFTLDSLSAFFSFVISLVALAASIYGIHYAREYEEKGENTSLMAFFFNLFVVSMLLVVSASNVFWFMVFWELMTAASYFLICFNDEHNTRKATVLYMTIAHIGGSAILAAFVLMAISAHSLDFSSFSNASLSPVMAAVIFLLALFGFGSKAGFVPLHVWLPKAHPQAPSNVSALMSGVMIKTAIYGIIRFATWLPLHEWMGILILVIGALSSLLGVLYALMQHDYKALLAYHSIENIGIILLGVGVGVYGLATGNSLLATIGFLGGLYHVLNHATFKGLLFLGAGSVLYRVHTRDMEVLGGLAKKMPLTALAFLVGSMAISALPPLNGFVSEWFTYQSMIHATIEGSLLEKLIFPASIIALALTGALAVMCFVKVYSVIFSGVPRNRKLWEKAKESPILMVVGMYVLVIGCILFGLGAPYVSKEIIQVSKFLTSCSYRVADSVAVYSTLPTSLISPVMITIILLAMMVVPVIMAAVYRDSLSAVVRETPTPWACGAKYTPRMQMTAAPFTGALRKLVDWLYRSEIHFEETNGYFGPVKYSAHARDIFWEIFYKPVIRAIDWSANTVRKIQNGNVQLYASYILVALVVLLVISVSI